MSTPCRKPRGAAAHAWFNSVAQDVHCALGSLCEITPQDRVTRVASAILLAGVPVSAGYWPGRRAARVSTR